MPSEHSRSSSGSSVTSVPTINVKYAPPQLKKNQLNSTSNNELLDISNGTSREKSPSRERDSRGKSPGRNGKRGKSPSGDKLDPPKSPNSSRSRSRSRSKSPRNKKENERNENSKNSKSTQDARVNLNLNVAPWIAPSAKTSGGSKSNSRSSRLSLPPNFSEINMNAIRESNERWERLNHVPNDSKDGGKNGMGNFSKPVPLRIAPLIRPKIVTDMNNLQGGKSMQRNPSGQLTGKLTESPLVVDAGFPLMRSRSYNSAINESHRVHTEFSRDLKPHPLQHSWTMYYDSKPAMTPGPKTPTGKISYEENLQTIGTFNTVETFCRYFNWVKKPSQLELNTNFHIFKDKIMPMWEDPANANGGKWVISLRNPQLLDRCWTWLVYSLVGEELDEHDDICGAVMSRRSRGDRIAVWVRDKDNVPVINGIGRRLLKILDLQNENSIGMDFQFNEDALKSGTSYNNRVYLSLESLKQELEKERLDELSKAEKEQNNDADNVNVPETPKTEIKVTTPDEITTNVDVAPDATNNEETPQEKENKKDD